MVLYPCINITNSIHSNITTSEQQQCGSPSLVGEGLLLVPDLSDPWQGLLKERLPLLASCLTPLCAVTDGILLAFLWFLSKDPQPPQWYEQK